MTLAGSRSSDGVVCRDEGHGSVTAADEETGLARGGKTRAEVPTLREDAGDPVDNEDLSGRGESARTTSATNALSHRSGYRRSRVVSVTETSDIPNSNADEEWTAGPLIISFSTLIFLFRERICGAMSLVKRGVSKAREDGVRSFLDSAHTYLRRNVMLYRGVMTLPADPTNTRFVVDEAAVISRNLIRFRDEKG